MAGKVDPKRFHAPAGYTKQALARLAMTPEKRAAILKAAGLCEEDLATDDGKILVATQVALLQGISDIIGPQWAVDALPIWSPASQGALEVAMRSAATIGEGFDVLANFARVRAPQFSFSIHHTEKEFQLSIIPAIDLRSDLLRTLSEAVMLSAKALSEGVLHRPPTELVFEWPWSAPVYASQLETALAGACRYGAPRCAVTGPAALAATHSPYADDELHRMALSDLQRSLAALGGQTTRARLAALLAGPNGARLGVEDVASSLGVSRRTLARRLQNEATSFRQERDIALKRTAIELIKLPGLSREAIAARLAFNDPTSFSRACKRWFGKPFREVREEISHPSPASE